MARAPCPVVRRSRRGACRAMMSRISMSPCAECVSENIRCWPHRSQVIRMNHDGNAAERLVQGFPAGRQRIVAVAAPVPLRDRSRDHRDTPPTIST